MRSMLMTLAFFALPAPAQSAAVPMPLPAPSAAVWNPAAEYITVGQDEPGYRSWYLAVPSRAIQVKAFNDYLANWQVAGIVPTWQLLRTATSWHKCGSQPFELPPSSEWPHIVQTLRYVRDYVIPAVGPVEPVSAYRNPHLNLCAGGAPESAHKHYSAIDLVPLRPTSREGLMRTLCSAHARRGPDYGVGLGFYAFLRFHVDTTKYRRWNMDPAVASFCPPIVRQPVIAKASPPPLQPHAQTAPVPTVTEPPVSAVIGRPSAPTSDPLAPDGPPAPIDPLAPKQ